MSSHASPCALDCASMHALCYLPWPLPPLTVHAVRLPTCPSPLHGPLSECGCPPANVDGIEHHRSVPGAGRTTALAKFLANSVSANNSIRCHLPEQEQGDVPRAICSGPQLPTRALECQGDSRPVFACAVARLINEAWLCVLWR